MEAQLVFEIEQENPPPAPPRYKVLSCSNAYLLDPERITAEDDMTIHHGDNNEAVLSCRLVSLQSEASVTGKEIPKAWPDSGTISPQYLIKVCTLNVDGNTQGLDAEDPRMKRVLLADDDARRLHHARVQKECSAIDFQRVLNESHIDGRSTERIVSQLRCKAILNIASLSGLKQDIVGDCVVILTENIDPTNRYRRIYFVQTGVEFQRLDASENSERVKTSEKHTVDTEMVSQVGDVIQTTKQKVKETVINTYEEKKVDITCIRQTVSHMEVVSVEDQLIQVFCEQLDGTRLSKMISYKERTEHRDREVEQSQSSRPAPVGRPGTPGSTTPGKPGYLAGCNCFASQSCSCFRSSKYQSSPSCCPSCPSCPSCSCPYCPSCSCPSCPSCSCACCSKCPKCPSCLPDCCTKPSEANSQCSCRSLYTCSCFEAAFGTPERHTPGTPDVPPPAFEATKTVMPTSESATDRSKAWFRAHAANIPLPAQMVMSSHRMNTERRAGDPRLENLKSALGLHESVETAVEGANYTALYLRYTVPTSAQLHETVALLSPEQSLADAFRFVVASSSPPTQLARWGGGQLAAHPVRPPAEFDGPLVLRRNQLRGPAAAKAAMIVFEMPPTAKAEGKAEILNKTLVPQRQPEGEGGGEGRVGVGGDAGGSAGGDNRQGNLPRQGKNFESDEEPLPTPLPD